MVEMSDENIKEKGIKSSFAPYGVVIATKQDIDARLRQPCARVPKKGFERTWQVPSPCKDRNEGEKEVGSERTREGETERTTKIWSSIQFLSVNCIVLNGLVIMRLKKETNHCIFRGPVRFACVDTLSSALCTLSTRSCIHHALLLSLSFSFSLERTKN